MAPAPGFLRGAGAGRNPHCHRHRGRGGSAAARWPGRRPAARAAADAVGADADTVTMLLADMETAFHKVHQPARKGSPVTPDGGTN